MTTENGKPSQVRVQIDDKTWILIDKGKDPVKEKKKYLQLHKKVVSRTTKEKNRWYFDIGKQRTAEKNRIEAERKKNYPEYFHI